MSTLNLSTSSSCGRDASCVGRSYCILFLLIALPAQAQFSVQHSLIGSGAGVLSGSGLRLFNTFAQPFGGGSGPIQTGFWRISQEVTFTGAEGGPDQALPAHYVLEASYPNPFTRATTISYLLPHMTHVRLTVYDLLGRRVATLKNVEESHGRYTVLWNGQDDGGRAVASGTYLYRIETGNFARTRAMMLVR